MSIDRRVVEHISRLASIGLSAEEADEMARQLSSVLEHFSRLQAVNTESIEATGQRPAAPELLRVDEVGESWPPAAVLANAPARDGDLFEVQAVLE